MADTPAAAPSMIMYLGTEKLLLLTGGLAGILFLACIAALFTLARERGRNLLLKAKDESRSGELQALHQEGDRMRAERNSLLDENRLLAERQAVLKTSLEEKENQLRERDELLTATRQEMEKNFLLLADRILAEKGTAITHAHRDELTRLLLPVREQLGEFKKKVEDVYDRETRDRVSLTKEIEHLKSLNLRISEDAVNLTRALKGQSKIQGKWGEMILERLLESSGLRKGSEFEAQVALRDKNGQTRMPDVLIRLPRNREIIIDAKVSLKAYEKACRAEEHDEELRLIEQHIESVRQHVRGLAGKQYHLLEGVTSLDFVILFIPAEGAFQAAVTAAPDLLDTAMQKNIILASPSTLLAILRTVHHLWRQEEQARNSLAIAKQAGSLYDKFIGFLESFEEIGARLDQTRSAWEMSRKRLVSGRGNLVSRAETLKELGVQSSRSVPVSLQEASEYQANSRRLP